MCTSSAVHVEWICDEDFYLHFEKEVCIKCQLKIFNSLYESILMFLYFNAYSIPLGEVYESRIITF